MSDPTPDTSAEAVERLALFCETEVRDAFWAVESEYVVPDDWADDKIKEAKLVAATLRALAAERDAAEHSAKHWHARAERAEAWLNGEADKEARK